MCVRVVCVFVCVCCTEKNGLCLCMYVRVRVLVRALVRVLERALQRLRARASVCACACTCEKYIRGF